MNKTKSGFTIVELLIVIVVVAILAAVSVVAYNGVQQRAINGKTTAALGAWIEAAKLYKADNGRWPSGWTCLGTGYSYGPSGTDTSGVAQCRQDAAGSGVVENTTFTDTLKPYMGNGVPVPAFVTSRSSDTVWRRGLMYAYGGGGDATQVYILAALAGALTSCPSVDGVAGSIQIASTNTTCAYMIGSTTDT